MRTFWTSLVFAFLSLKSGCDCAGGPAVPGAKPEPADPAEVERTADEEDATQKRLAFPAAVYDFPGKTYLALAERGPYSEFESTMAFLIEYVDEQNIEIEGDIAGVYFDDPWLVDPEETIYEIRVPVPEGTKAEPPFVVLKVETEQHAMVRFVGPYDKIRDHISKLFVWIEENDYEAAGPVWELYLEHAGTGAKPAEYDTEIHVPVRKKDE